MKAEEYLRCLEHLDDEIKCKLEQLEELRALATKMSPSSGSGTSPSDRVGRIVAKIIDQEKEINSRIDKLLELQAEICREINKIPVPIQRVVLERKIILLESIEKIAEKIGYSVSHTKRIYKEAQNSLEKMILNDTK